MYTSIITPEIEDLLDKVRDAVIRDQLKDAAQYMEEVKVIIHKEELRRKTMMTEFPW